MRGWFRGLHGWRRVLAWVVAVVVVVGGGIVVYHEIDEHQMREIVYGIEAKKIYKKMIKLDDPKAFSSQGIIQSYQIDDTSIRHNPMGGIMVRLIINNDADLSIDTTLTRHPKTDGEGYGPLGSTGGDDSSKLVDLLQNSGLGV